MNLSLKVIILTLSAFAIFPFINYAQASPTLAKDSTTFQNNSNTRISLITGFQFNSNQFIELGVGFTKNQIQGQHKSTLVYGFTNELKLLGEDFIWGSKAALWMGGGASGVNAGLNLIHYTDFKNSTFQFRPEIGIGIKFFRVVYGYNISITNKDFQGINKHNFGINFIIF